MALPLRVLIIDQSPEEAALLVERLTAGGFDVDWRLAATATAVTEALEEERPWELMLVDCAFAGSPWRYALALLRKRRLDLPAIAVARRADEGTVTASMRAGARDFVAKDRLGRLLPAVRREIQEATGRRAKGLAEEELRRSHQAQIVLNRLLHLALEDAPLEKCLAQLIAALTAFPWLALEPRGAIFLKDEASPTLVMKAQCGLAPPLVSRCDRLPFDRCLCGRAAASREVIFTDDLDQQHEIAYPGIHPHGHYCVPILARDRSLLGVFTVYTEAGARRDRRVEETLLAAASVVAEVISRKRTEAALAASEERYRILVENIDLGITLIDPQHRIVMTNAAQGRLFGRDARSFVGQPCHEAFESRPTVCDGCPGTAAMTSGEPQEAEREGVRPDGSRVAVRIRAFPVIDPGGRPTGFIEVVEDLSRARQLETEQAALEARLRQAQKMEAIGTLAGGIAHDFNNILSAILGYSDLARSALPQGSPIRDDVEQVVQAGQRAKDLVQQILAFSRQAEVEHKPLQIHLVVKEVLKLLRAIIPSTITLRQNIEARAGTVLADPVQIHQVLMNLCTNAYQAMRERGGILAVELSRVDLQARATRGDPELAPRPYVRLLVTDSGPGIDAAIIDRIFEPYFTTKAQGEGTGLGLAVSHGIVTNLGGTVTVANAPEGGAIFTVLLPRVEEEIGDEGRDHLGCPGGRERVLLVDDEPAVAGLEGRILEQLGYQVTVHTRSVAALAAFEAAPQRFDCLLTDQTMPGCTGLDLARQVLARRPGLPVVLCTGFSEGLDPGLVRQAGIRTVLRKPLLARELGEALRRVLDEDKERYSSSGGVP
ncbi:MAG: response regulator [Thermodesulfobacteriota bacterium]